MREHDVLIIGGGPAGMSALIWCHSLGLRGIAFERASEPGGQMLSMYHQIPDYPGLPLITGREMRDRFLDHIDSLGLDLRTACNLSRTRLVEKEIVCNDEVHHGRAIIIATGARKRGLDLPGEERFPSSGISYSATRDHSLYAGKVVAVVGGGDSAVENALILSRVCPRVYLIHRSDRFRAREEWISQARQTPSIQFLPWHSVTEIHGSDSIEAITLLDSSKNTKKALKIGGLFIKIGIAPNTEDFRGQVDMDEEGYLMTDKSQRTSVEMVYAAGDVCRPVCLSVATAVGHGAIAAKAIAEVISGRQFNDRRAC